MELYQLRTLIVVAREQHLTRASERLHISQPAVSGQIKSLETELGLTLFLRKSGGMQLTEQGESLLQHAETVLSAATELTAEARRLSGRIIGKISLGVILTPTFIRLGELTAALLASYPDLDIDFRHRNSTAGLQGVRSRELDASFYLGKGLPEDIGSIELCPVSYVVVASPAWADKLVNANWQTVASMPWVTTPKESAFYRMVEALLRDHGHEPKSIVEADQESMVISLVQAGVGISLVRRGVADNLVKTGELITWDQGKATSTLSLIYLASRANDPVTQAIASTVRRLIAG
ncbi:MAG TPA: LysR family transcriptional regulator [Eoetvoesiella sp.]